jgi:hypothetical protein
MNGDKSTPTTDRIRNMYSWAYAWRTADDEGETDLNSLRGTLRAEFDGWLAEHDRAVLSEAADALDRQLDRIGKRPHTRAVWALNSLRARAAAIREETEQ